MKKYFVEAFLIFISVLSSFSIDSYLEKVSKINLKNELLNELSFVINEDLKQLTRVKALLNDCISSTSRLIDDFKDRGSMQKNKLAKDFLYLKQNGHMSFFPQDAVYKQLIQTGSIELINNDELRKKLFNVYDHLLKRKEFGDKVMDDFGVDFGRDMSNFIIVLSDKSEDKSLVYSDQLVTSFEQFNGYYDSKKVLYYYSEYNTWISSFIDILGTSEEIFNEILVLIESEK
tara:strand:+ start:55 stop:747 length:693 start_codon:yes stop_codon:yes gene_type:complete